MNDEKGMRVLTSLVALGIFIVAGLAALYQSVLALPLAVIGLIFVPFILMQNSEKYAHLAENLEKTAFIITFLIMEIISSFSSICFIVNPLIFSFLSIFSFNNKSLIFSS